MDAVLDPPQQAAAPPPPPPPGFMPAAGQAASGGTPPPPPGFVPAGAPAPAAPPPPAPAPAQKSLMGRIGDFLGDIATTAAPISSVGDINKGFVKGAVKTVAGVGELANKYGDFQVLHPTEDPGMHSAALKSATDWLRDHAEDHGVWQQLGDMGENVAEFLVPGLGEETAPAKAGKAVEALSYADKAAQTAKLATFLESHPKVAQLAALGARTLKAAATGAARTGLEAGGQTLVKTGGDTDAALTAGAEGAAAGGVLGGIATGVGGAVADARNAYQARAAAGDQTSSQYNKALAEYHQAVADRTSGAQDATAYRQRKVDAQNTQWRTAVEQQDAEHAAALEAHRAELTARGAEIDKARADWKSAIDAQQQSHAAAMEAYTQQVGQRTATQEAQRTAWKAELDRQAQQHAADLAEYNQHLGDHTQKLKALQTQAGDALRSQRQIEAQQGIRDTARDATEDALTRFNAARGASDAAPVDAIAAAKSVRSFGDTADAIRDAAKPVYDRINEVTGGKFAALQADRQAAIRAQDFAASDKAENAINALLEKNPGVKPEEYRAARTAWRDSRDIDRIHTAVEGAFNGISEDMAAQAGTSPRLLKSGTADSGALQSRLGTLLRGPKAMTEGRIAELIGKDGLAGLYRASHMVSTPELRIATQKLSEEVAAQLSAPVKPTAPIPAERPAALPPVEKPVKPTPPDRPEFPSKPEPPAKPAPIPRPQSVPRPPPQGPAPVRPTPPIKASGRDTLAREIGGHTAEGIAGLIIGHATGLPYPYTIGGVAATRYVLRQMVTNPAVGKMAEYAVDYGAKPEHAAKVIAALIQKQATDDSQKAAQK